MKAIVLCGGLGSRLGALTRDTPKPLISVAGRPFLAHVLDKLCIPEVDGFVLATGFQAQEVSRAIGVTWRGRPVCYSVEPEALGTGGALRLAMNRFDLDFALVANGDTLFDCDLSALVNGFSSSPWSTRMALRHLDDCGRYGRVLLGGGHLVTGFGEKGHAGPGLINAGLYVQHREPLAGFGTGSFSLESDYLAKLAPEWPIQGLCGEGYFIDIGIPEDLERARRDLVATGD